MAAKIAKAKKLPKPRLALILIIAALLAITATQLVWHYYRYERNVEQTKVYEMKLSVGDHIGFNLENQTLNFGTVIPDGSVQRDIWLATGKPVQLEIILKGKLARWITVSENNFVLEGSKALAFTAKVPEDAPFGNYTGRAIILFRKI